MLNQRAGDVELLDRPDSDPDPATRGYEFMRLVNRIGGGTRVVRRFLAREWAASPAPQDVRILDLGAGSCDIALDVTRWAMRRGVHVEFSCLDHSPAALELARQVLARAGCTTVRPVQGDLFTYSPPAAYDYAIGSMVFHHLSQPQIVGLVAHLRSFVTKALLINDLHRCPLNYAACYLLSLGRDRAVRHDALLSVRRGFRTDDLSAILDASGTVPRVTTAWFCRIAAVVRFEERDIP